MSRNSLDGKDDFDEQLRLQQLYGNTQKGPGRENSFGQQPDDTPYEWDLDKKAWFPKVSVRRRCPCRAGRSFSFPGLGVEPPLVVAFLFVLLLQNRCVKERKLLGRCRTSNLILVFFSMPY